MDPDPHVAEQMLQSDHGFIWQSLSRGLVGEGVGEGVGAGVGESVGICVGAGVGECVGAGVGASVHCVAKPLISTQNLGR